MGDACGCAVCDRRRAFLDFVSAVCCKDVQGVLCGCPDCFYEDVEWGPEPLTPSAMDDHEDEWAYEDRTV